jgi:hypothetical protein
VSVLFEVFEVFKYLEDYHTHHHSTNKIRDSSLNNYNRQFSRCWCGKRKMGNQQGKNDAPFDNEEARRTKNSLMNGVSSEGIIVDREYTTASDGSPVRRRLTSTETEVVRRKSAVDDIVSRMPEQPSMPQVSAYIPFMLADAIFCGHLVTDLDSIAGRRGPHSHLHHI